MFEYFEMDRDISDMLGVTLKSVTGAEGDDEIHFVAEDGREWLMFHRQDCCEHVRVEEVIGDTSDLIGAPLVEAECVSNHEGDPAPEFPESWTWTFYKLRTEKGCVTLRWLGESNGYYGEGVDFVRKNPGKEKAPEGAEERK